MNDVWRRVGAVMIGGVLVLVAVVLWRAVDVDSQQRAVESVDVELDDPDGAVDRLSAAIQIPTISPAESDDERRAFVELRELVASEFPAVDNVAEHHRSSELTMHFEIPGADDGAPHVVFLAHADVVPVESGTADEWSYPPFSGAVEEGYVWGRGTLDNKHNMMALLEAVEAMLVAEERPDHTVHLVFGHDEEVGGLDGARRVARSMEEQQLDVVAVYDEGLVITEGLVPGVEEPIGLVGIGEKGYLTVEITARAEGGHASMPPQDLAVSRLSRALQAIDDEPAEAAIDGAIEEMFRWSVSEMDLGHRMIFRNLWLFEPLVLSQMADAPSTNAAVRTTASPTMLRASERENVLPQRAVATVNLRIDPRDSIDGVIERLQARIDDDEISVDAVGEMRSEPSPQASIDGPGFEALETATGEVFGDMPLAPGLVVAATDSRHFTGLTDDIYRFSPVVHDERDLERIHGTDERIGVDDYLNLIRYYDRLLRQW